MKKLVFFIICLTIILFVIQNKDNKSFDDSQENPVFEERGVFISYIDYGVLRGKNKNEMESIISEMINNVSYFGLNSIILQTSPFSDAIYPSKIYKSSHVVVHEEGDPLPLDILKYFIDKAKEKNISVYAWVNPYRIRNDNNIGDINKDTYYYEWLKTDNIEITDNGIFYMSYYHDHEGNVLGVAIYKSDLDGNNTKQLYKLEESSTSLCVLNDWIYYLDSNDEQGRMEILSLDGKQRIVLNSLDYKDYYYLDDLEKENNNEGETGEIENTNTAETQPEE